MTVTKPLIEPLIAVRICSPTGVFHPGDVLRCEYQIDAVQPAEIQAVEASIMWYTEGKGDEDLGVHYFERTRPATRSTATCGNCTACRRRCRTAR